MAYKSKREFLEKEEVLKNRLIYRLPCKISNWYEDMALKEQISINCKKKAENCHLITQKTRILLRNILKPTKLAEHAEFVRYGCNYLIRTSDILNLATPDNSLRQGKIDLCLAGVIKKKDIDTMQEFTHGCTLSACLNREPCVRNTFRLVGCENDTTGNPILYEHDFYIQIVGGGSSPLYIRSPNISIGRIGVERDLYMVEVPDFHCRFKVIYWDPKLRYEYYGALVLPGIKLLIQHSASGQNLAVQYTNFIHTFFGDECKVVCKTYRDTHRMECSENFWTFDGNKGLNMNMVVRAAAGESIPDVYLE